MAQFETGHPQHLTRESRGGLAYRMGDQIEGRHAPVIPPKKEPALIRQKPPRSVQDAKPAGDKIKVKCRQAIRAGQAQTIPLIQAKGKFQSHQLKCQNCAHRMQCATA